MIIWPIHEKLSCRYVNLIKFYVVPSTILPGNHPRCYNLTYPCCSLQGRRCHQRNFFKLAHFLKLYRLFFIRSTILNLALQYFQLLSFIIPTAPPGVALPTFHLQKSAVLQWFVWNPMANLSPYVLYRVISRYLAGSKILSKSFAFCTSQSRVALEVWTAERSCTGMIRPGL